MQIRTSLRKNLRPLLLVVLVAAAAWTLRIDTGNAIGAFVVPLAFAEKLSFIGDAMTVGRARSLSGEMEIKTGRVRETARMGTHEFREPEVTYPSLGEMANIGAKAFADCTLTLDQRNSRLRLVRSETRAAGQ